MTLNEHICELKIRLILTLIFMFGAIVISYFYADKIFEILLAPLTEIFKNGTSNHKLIYTNLTEAFVTKIKLSIFTGLLISFPIITWHIYKFIAPGLFKKEKLASLPYIIFSPLLFISGAYLAYKLVMPLAWQFFLSFEHDLIIGIPLILEPKISEYIALTTTMIIAFGIAFQLPILLMLLVDVGLIDTTNLINSRKYAIVLIFLIAAVITPPDVLSQVMLAIPLMLLYEISILICKCRKS